jgi:hypothetical protein
MELSNQHATSGWQCNLNRPALTIYVYEISIVLAINLTQIGTQFASDSRGVLPLIAYRLFAGPPRCGKSGSAVAA